MTLTSSHIQQILDTQEAALVDDWVRELESAGSRKDARIGSAKLREHTREFISLLRQATKNGVIYDDTRSEWREIFQFLKEVSKSRVQQGFSSDETARFIFSFKRPLFAKLREALVSQPEVLAEEMWSATLLLDDLGMQTVSAYQQTREDVIQRQQAEMLELSTPVVKLWDGVLALPMIGTLDSNRTQIVMESLLQRIVDTEAEIAIIDITGVPTVDTLVAQHLLKTVTAIRLMGADCIISGIRPQIAQTIVHLGVDLEGVTSKATLADALSIAMKRLGFSISKSSVRN